MKIIKKQLIDFKQPYEFIYTTKRGEAIDIVKKYKNDIDTKIYSVGGDGTLNEVVNGIVNTNLKLGIIPIGTGNDFVKSIKNGFNDKIDVIKVNDKYSINIVSFGLDASVANKVNLLKENKYEGKILYKFALIDKFLKYKNESIYINGKIKKPTILTICNGRYYGGGFQIAPNALINDGYLDMYLVDDISKLKIFMLIFKLLNGTHTNNKLVNYNKIKKLSIYSENHILCNIDGEIIKDKKFEIEILDKNINLEYDDEFKLSKILKK